MNIVVCIKRVPVTEAQAKVAADGASLDTSGFQYMLSFYDEIAVEEAIRAKEKLGGEVTVISLGPPDATKEIREALAKGADQGVLVVDPGWMQRDARATARILSEEARKRGAQVVFTGRVATDRDNAAVGPMMATFLGWACATDVCALELSEQGATARRETEAGVESIELSLPAVITCDKSLNEPRYAGLKGIMAAKKKPVEELPCPDVPSQIEIVSVALPPPRKEGRIVGEGAAAVPALIDALRNEAQVL